MSKNPKLKRSSSDHGAEALFNSASRFISIYILSIYLIHIGIKSNFPLNYTNKIYKFRFHNYNLRNCTNNKYKKILYLY